MVKNQEQLEKFLQFLESSPTAWHAVDNLRHLLVKAKFEELSEKDSWQLQSGKGYFVHRNGSSLVAFRMPKKHPQSAIICGTHTDSPALKLKPNAEFLKENHAMLGVEVYGAPLLTSWLNRDLGIAGRVVGLNAKGEVTEALVNLKQFAAVIPQLAIHLDRKVNDEGLVLNKQEHLAALYGLANKKNSLEKEILLQSGLKSLLAHDLFLYPLDKPRFTGCENTFISGYRLDSLASVHALAEAFVKDSKADESRFKVAAFFDNEEIGSSTAQGADSPFLPNVLERVYLSLNASREDYLRMIPQSLCISIDLAHALHPNYAEKTESGHRTFLSQGVAIKTHANHAYATSALTAAIIKKAAAAKKILIQQFVSRSDMASGTTIGPIHAGLTGMPTVDIGIPQLSMHSARELIASKDYLDLTNLISILLS